MNRKLLKEINSNFTEGLIPLDIFLSDVKFSKKLKIGKITVQNLHISKYDYYTDEITIPHKPILKVLNQKEIFLNEISK